MPQRFCKGLLNPPKLWAVFESQLNRFSRTLCLKQFLWVKRCIRSEEVRHASFSLMCSQDEGGFQHGWVLFAHLLVVKKSARFCQTMTRRLKFIQYRTGVWKCLRSLPPDPSPSAGKKSGPIGAQFLSSTGLEFGTLIVSRTAKNTRAIGVPKSDFSGSQDRGGKGVKREKG